MKNDNLKFEARHALDRGFQVVGVVKTHTETEWLEQKRLGVARIRGQGFIATGVTASKNYMSEKFGEHDRIFCVSDGEIFLFKGSDANQVETLKAEDLDLSFCANMGTGKLVADDVKFECTEAGHLYKCSAELKDPNGVIKKTWYFEVEDPEANKDLVTWLAAHSQTTPNK